MARFATAASETPTKRIKKRVMELFETADDLKKLFNEILPKNTLLKSILKIDKQTDKEKICDTLLAYLGNNFFYSVGYVKSDDEENNATNKNYTRNLIREKFLEQLCKYQKDNSEKVRKEIIDSFNEKHWNTEVTTLKELCSVNWKDQWGIDLCNKYLLLPDIIVEKPETIPQLPITIPIKTKSQLSQLYDFQTKGLIKIHNYLSQAEDLDGMQKRTLIMMPTGSGKTRMTVQALVEWLNLRDRLRDQGKTENFHEQQRNENGMIFWLASTNELCDQASEAFREIFNQIGTAGLVNLTHWYGKKRDSLENILDRNPGTHIVITNTIHTNQELKTEKGEGTRRIDYWKNSEYFEFIRKNTIAIVIDEAHEVTGEGYQNFLASMGFDYSGRKESQGNINTHNIVLIGLSATPYRGSGIRTEDSKDQDDGLEEFMELDQDKEPSYFKDLDNLTKKIHKTFGRIFVPIPSKEGVSSIPIAIINAPDSANVGDSIKISGTDSYDLYSDLTFSWKISLWNKPLPKQTESEFYQTFNEPGSYMIKLVVTNGKNISSSSVSQSIRITPRPTAQITGTGSLEDTKEFYEILTHDREILCEITHGVIDGPQLSLSPKEFRDWKKGTLQNDTISNDVKYNRQICDMIDKCVRVYNKKRVLVFANSVKHSQELALILRVNYGHDNAQSVDGTYTKTGIRRKIVKQFRETEEIPILCNYAVFTTGFDVPKIDVVIICRDIGSNAEYTQMIGRGQRGPVARGTPELWLITSNFPKPNQTESQLKLGWEGLAEGWKKFPKEIRDNLGLKDFEYKSQVPKEKLEIKAKEKPHRIVTEPIANLTLRCLTCGIVTQGLQNCLKFYGYDPKTDPSVIKHALEKDEFYKHCSTCRKIRNIAKKSKDEVVKYAAENHEYNTHFLFVMFFACTIKSNKHWQGRQAKLSDLVDDLVMSWQKKIPKDHFDLDHPIIRKLERDKILEIDEYLNLKFKKIIDSKSLLAVLRILAESETLKDDTAKILNQYESSQTSKRSKPEEGTLEFCYEELKKELGHVPTQRQFESKLDKNLKTKFTKQYQVNYTKFLDSKREKIKDDLDLKDSLYDEYFEKCMEERSPITRDQLDAYGDYRIEDYEDVWGSFDRFQDITSLVLTNVLENMDELKNKRDKEFEEISKDLIELRRKRGINFSHFDEIWQHGGIRIFRYIIQLKISYLKYLEKYYGQYPGEFLHLVSEYLPLKKDLGRVPLRIEFTDSTSPNTTAAFLKLFKGDYDKFLKVFGDTPPDSTLGNHA